MFMSVVDHNFVQGADCVATAFWSAGVEAGVDAPAGQAAIGSAMNGVNDVGFVVSEASLHGEGVLGCAQLTLPTGGWALRVDEVAFPVGAIAHRHTHTGSGWRHLLSGELRIEAAHETTVMTKDSSWFEPAHSPVRAVALQNTGVTRFLRCMAIPLADVGRSTFQLAAQDDANLPRLQLTHRHFDHVVQVDAL